MNQENFSNNLQDNAIRLLWTGGWDSTFRMLQLSELDRRIEPIYVRYPGRYSASTEEATMKKLLARIRALPGTRADLQDVLVIPYAEIPAMPEVTKAYEDVNRRAPCGPQYEYLSRLSYQYPGIEIGIEPGEGLIDDALGKNASRMLRIAEDECYHYYLIDPEVVGEDMYTFFKNFRLPIYDTSRQKMIEIAQTKEGWMDILNSTWFCHYPANGEPCGSCVPCQIVVEDGLGYRIGEKGMKRYRMQKKYEKTFWYPIYKKFRRKFLRY
ncbi:MAG: hypothetical protein GX260_03390 [Tissierellia bacterium]|nr:hypothetical protein [Bacillota bacterium]NLL22808.1 hypothetical protein [Tissierellia bacterium]